MPLKVLIGVILPIFVFISNHFLKFSGWSYSCGLFSSKKVRCWGSGQYGVLGTDSTSSVTRVSTLGYIPFSDTSEVVSLAQGGTSNHVIYRYFVTVLRCNSCNYIYCFFSNLFIIIFFC